MDTTNDSLAELRAQHGELTRKLHNAVLETNTLRLELLSGVMEVRRMIQRNLSRRPGSPTSHYWKTFGEHWRSFELFSDKIDIAQQQLSVPFDLDDGLLEQPDGVNADILEDLVDDMEEALHKLKMGKASQKQLMAVVELVDSAERLAVLVIPRSKGKGAEFTETLQNLRRSAQDVVDYLMELLAKHGIARVDLSIGQYPPPETTRIISRNDSNTDDNVVVNEIVLNGYMWQDKLLRKADVIVTSSEGA